MVKEKIIFYDRYIKTLKKQGKLMENYGNSIENIMEIYGSSMKNIEIYGNSMENSWKCMEILWEHIENL